MTTEVPEPDHDDEKEVYAFYGLAMYAAQVFEHSLLNLATGLYLNKVPVITRQIFDATFDDLDRKTLGALLRSTRSLMSIPDNNDAILSDALSKRNYLAHQFFRVHADVFMHEQGRREMITELQTLIRNFQRADELATPLYMSVWKHFGVDEAWIERELESVRREVSEKFAEL